MEVLVATHPSSLRHDTGRMHPERPERVTAVMRGLRGSGLDISELESPPAARSELALVHDASYIEMIETFCSLGGGALDMDTVVSKDSWEAALTAAGGVRALVEELESRSGFTGFAVSRPPGHHALRDRAMGFCLFNNVAVTAALLRSRGLRVAILDWDVHHGNGTQALTADDPGILYASIHQDHFYPFEGELSDIDTLGAKGTVVNIPLPAGSGGAAYRLAWGEIVLPVVRQFVPDWILVSAGYDAHGDDPLAGMRLEADDYGWMAARLAETYPGERIVVSLEGGYDLDALEQSAATTLMGLAGLASEPATGEPSDAEVKALEAARWIIARHWRLPA